MNEIDPRVRLAQLAVETYIREGRVMDIPDDLPPGMLSESAGTFVCIKRDGGLRGCIGTIQPTRDCLAEEIIVNAISAATRDPRFLPLCDGELDGLEFTVDVLTPPEEVHDIRDLDPKRYGVIVESGQGRGLLLPDLEGVDSVEQQIDIARRKAFISPAESIKLYRFEVRRYH